MAASVEVLAGRLRGEIVPAAMVAETVPTAQDEAAVMAGAPETRDWWGRFRQWRQIGNIRRELGQLAEANRLLTFNGSNGEPQSFFSQKQRERARANLERFLLAYRGDEISLADLSGLTRAGKNGDVIGVRRAERMMAAVAELSLPEGVLRRRGEQLVLTPRHRLPGFSYREVPVYLLDFVKNYPRRLVEDFRNTIDFFWWKSGMSRQERFGYGLGLAAAVVLPEMASLWLPLLGGRAVKTVARGGIRLGAGIYQERQRRILEGELDERQRIAVAANLGLINAFAAGAGVSLVGFSGRYLTEGIGPIGRIGQIGAIGLITRAAAFKNEFSSLFDRLPKEVTVSLNFWGAMEKVASGLLAVAKEIDDKVGAVRDFGEAEGKGEMSDGAVKLAEKLRETRFYIPPESSFHQQATGWAEDLTGGDELARDNILGKLYRILRLKFAHGQLGESIIWSGTVKQRFIEVETVGNFGEIVKVMRPQDVVYESNQVDLTHILDKGDFEHLVYAMGGDIDNAKAVAREVCVDGCGPNRVVDLSAALQEDWQNWQTGNLSAEKAAEGVEGKVREFREFGEIGEGGKMGEMGEKGVIAGKEEFEGIRGRGELRQIRPIRSIGEIGEGEIGGGLRLEITTTNNSLWKAAAELAKGLPLRDGYTQDNFAGGLLELAQEKGLMDGVLLRTHPGNSFDLRELLGTDVNELGRYLDLKGMTLTEWLARQARQARLTKPN